MATVIRKSKNNWSGVKHLFELAIKLMCDPHCHSKDMFSKLQTFTTVLTIFVANGHQVEALFNRNIENKYKNVFLTFFYQLNSNMVINSFSNKK